MATEKAKDYLAKSTDNLRSFSNDDTYKGNKIGQNIQWTGWKSTDPRLLKSQKIDCKLLVFITRRHVSMPYII